MKLYELKDILLPMVNGTGRVENQLKAIAYKNYIYPLQSFVLKDLEDDTIPLVRLNESWLKSLDALNRDIETYSSRDVLLDFFHLSSISLTTDVLAKSENNQTYMELMPSLNEAVTFTDRSSVLLKSIDAKELKPVDVSMNVVSRHVSDWLCDRSNKLGFALKIGDVAAGKGTTYLFLYRSSTLYKTILENYSSDFYQRSIEGLCVDLNIIANYSPVDWKLFEVAEPFEHVDFTKDEFVRTENGFKFWSSNGMPIEIEYGAKAASMEDAENSVRKLVWKF